MSKFKIGDKVKLRNDLVVDKLYGRCVYNKKMRAINDTVILEGTVVTIEDIDEKGDYTIKENLPYYYSEQMFLKLPFQIGDKVKLRDDLVVGKYYNDVYFSDEMCKNLGKEFVVHDIDIEGYYTIKTVKCSYILNESFSEEMLEPINKIESKKTESEEIEMEQNNNKLEQLKAEFEGLVKQYKIEMETFQINFNTKLEELKKEIENEKNKKKPFIEEGQEYYFIDSTGDVRFDFWNNHPVNRQRLDFGNCFPYTEENKEQVEKEVNLIAERRKLQNEMEMFARLNNDHEIDWSNTEQQKWYLCIDYEDNEVDMRYTYYYREPNITYFTSEEVIDKAIEKFGDRLEELYFN